MTDKEIKISAGNIYRILPDGTKKLVAGVSDLKITQPENIMTEEEILDIHCTKIEKIVNDIKWGNERSNYSFVDMLVDIRAEVQEAMRKARREALRGN